MPPAWCCHKQIGMFLKTMEECRNLVAVAAAVVAAVAEAFLLVGAVDFYYVPCSNNRV